MSVEAISWALNEAPDVPPSSVAVLIGLANHASHDGRGAYPSQPTLARYARKTERAIRNDLATLERAGVIRRGDQRLVDHLPPDRRPVVWDLAMPSATAHNGGKHTSARNHTSARKQGSARNHSSEPGGSTLPPAGGSTLPPNRPTEPTTEPSLEGRASATSPAPPPAKPRRPDGLTEIPGDFRPTDSMRRWAISTYGTALDLEYETEQFISHYRSTGARRKSWPDAWQKWVRQSAEHRPRSNANVVPIDRRQQATDALFDRAMQRAMAREEQQ